MLALLLGLVFVVGGVFGAIVWKEDFISVMKGLVPAMLAIGGMISVVAGATSVAESLSPKQEEERSEADGKGKQAP